MAEQISVNFGAVEEASMSCQTIANNIEGELTDLTSYLNELVWVGAARESYDRDQASWNRGAQELQQILMGLSASVSKANEDYQTTEKMNASMFGDSAG